MIERESLKNIRNIDLSKELDYQCVVDIEEWAYIGHPDTILLDDGKTILACYPQGHGKGKILFKKSTDGGITWSDRLDTPKSFQLSEETPTMYKLDLINGKKKYILISGVPRGNGGFRTSFLDINTLRWSEFKEYFSGRGLMTLVAHASLTQLKDEQGMWQDKWMGIFHDFDYNNWKVYLTFDTEDNEIWSEPERLLEDYDDIEKSAGLCEIEIIRSPDGKELCLVARSQHKKHNSMFAVSYDEGQIWTRPQELPTVLMGERHKGLYDNKSNRLLITYRQIIRDPNEDGDDNNWVAGHWMAWIGTYDDLINKRPGQYLIRILEDFTPSLKAGDCGYAGVNILECGTMVLTSYGYWHKGAKNPYIKSVRFKLKDIE